MRNNIKILTFHDIDNWTEVQCRHKCPIPLIFVKTWQHNAAPIHLYTLVVLFSILCFEIQSISQYLLAFSKYAISLLCYAAFIRYQIAIKAELSWRWKLSLYQNHQIQNCNQSWTFMTLKTWYQNHKFYKDLNILVIRCCMKFKRIHLGKGSL